MNADSFFNKGMLRALICLILAGSLAAALCLPGMNMKTAQPQTPLDAQEILDIHMLEVSENISSLTPIVVPTGGSAKPTEPQEEDENSETPDTEQSKEGEENQEEDGSGNGDKDGNEEGLQGAEGGKLVPELAVILTWTENRNESRSLSCQPSGTVYADVLNNRLSGGALNYEVSLAGEDVGEAMIEQVSWQSDSGTGVLNQRGTLYLQGGTYRITVSVVCDGQRVPFHFDLNFINDITLKMEYTIREDGRTVTREAICENTRSRTLEDIYSDQLRDGMLEYRFTIVGADGGAEITAVSCFQSGSGNSLNDLDTEGEIRLLLKNGKTGENTFTVRARSENGASCHFTFNVPYKPRGAEILQIDTYDLVDGQTVTTGSAMNFRVSAQNPENGMFIPAEGTDTVFRVTFNGLSVTPDSSNGRIHDYIVVPPDPVIDDTNDHILYIYAEDSFGNWGEKTVFLNGQRAQEGQIIGTAYIYVDMTVLGLGIVGPVEYDVLSNEPVSYTVLKAIAGQDMGEIYGSARDNFGWRIRHDGNPDPNRGFYLKNIYTGYSATAMEDASWPRREDNSIDLDAIDAYFGPDMDMATLWRCIARNGIAKSGPDPDGGFGQFDYTGSSGWMYTVNGIFPTEGMDKYNLKDGDTLTLLYTLAGGWDVGGAGSAETNQVGYCIQSVGGSLVTNHIWVDNECVCCGRVLSCLHENTEFIDLYNGQHVQHCYVCGEDVGSPAYHTWKINDGDTANHYCQVCNAPDAHFWQEKQIVREASCTVDGEKLEVCDECRMERTVTIPAGHIYGGESTWDFNEMYPGEHWQICERCAEGEHIPMVFYWDEDMCDYVCQCGNNCGITHDFQIAWTYDCSAERDPASTCELEIWNCSCGNRLYKPGTHNYENGSCTECGALDPNHSHSWGEEYDVSLASCTEDGVKGHDCTVCGETETWVAETAWGHSFLDGYCESCGAPDLNFAQSGEELSLFTRNNREERI